MKNTPQTNSAHKHLQLGSHLTEPNSAWKIHFSSPPVEIWVPIIHTLTLTRRATYCAQGEGKILAYLIYRMGTWKRKRPLKSQQRRLEEEKGKKNKQQQQKPFNFNDEPTEKLYWEKSTPAMAEGLLSRCKIQIWRLAIAFAPHAGMTVILADQIIIFISNMDHKLFLDFGKLFVVFV